MGEQEEDGRHGATCSVGAAQLGKRMWGMAVFLLLAHTFQSMSWPVILVFLFGSGGASEDCQRDISQRRWTLPFEVQHPFKKLRNKVCHKFPHIKISYANVSIRCFSRHWPYS